MAEWVDRNAPWLLAAEFVIMLVDRRGRDAHRPVVYAEEETEIARQR